jgi:hypothetical protein
MRIIGCDLHARQQSLAMLHSKTGEVANRTLMHEGNEVREFYSLLPRPVLVGMEAIGPMQSFLKLLDAMGIACPVGDAAKIRAAEPRQQKHDRRAADRPLDYCFNCISRKNIISSRHSIAVPMPDCGQLDCESRMRTTCPSFLSVRNQQFRSRPLPRSLVSSLHLGI